MAKLLGLVPGILMILLLSKIWPYLVSIGAFIAGVLAIYFKGRRDANLKNDDKEKTFVIDQVKKGNKLQDKQEAEEKKLYEKIENTEPDNLPRIYSDILSSGTPSSDALKKTR